jgi:hypothetical protein
MEETKYTNTQVVSNITSIDQGLTTKFQPLNDERMRNFNMMVSDLQWDKKAKEKLEREGRPAKAYQLISPVIKNISGYEKGGRKKLAVTGRTSGDFDKAMLMNHLVDFFHSKANFDYQKSRAFLDAIIGRWGIMYQGWSFENDPEGTLDLRRYNPFRIKFDMDFSDLTWKDCKYVIDSAWYSEEEILLALASQSPDMYEEIKVKAAQYYIKDPQARKTHVNTWISRLVDAVGSWFNYKDSESYNPNVMNNNLEWFDANTSKFKVVEMHERRLRQTATLYDPSTDKLFDITGAIRTEKGEGFDNDKLQLIRAKFKDPQVKMPMKKEIWVSTVIPAFNMLCKDEAYPIQNGNFMFTPIWAYDFHADPLRTQSVVDELLDPQSDYNKRRSTLLELTSRYASMGYVMAAGAEKGFEDEWQNKKIGGVRHINDAFWGKWQQDQPVQVPQEIVRDQIESKMLLEEISGVTKASKGQTEASGESGRLFLAKKDQTDVMLQYLFDNLDMATLQIGRNTVDLIQYYCTEPRMIRITEDGQPQDLVLNQRVMGEIKNDVSIGEYDLEISQEPYGRTARQLEFAKLYDLMTFLAQIDPVFVQASIPLLIKASDTPYKNDLLQLVNSLQQQKMMQQQALEQQQQAMNQPDPMQQEAQAKQLERQGLENEKLGIENARSKADLVNQAEQAELANHVNSVLNGG